MTEDRVKARAGPAEGGDSRPGPHLLRGWRSVLFAPVGAGQRRRRGRDGLRLAAALLTLVCCLLIIRYDSRIDRAIIQVIHPPPRSITWLVTVVYDAGSAGITIALLALPDRSPLVIARRHRVSAAVTAAASGILVLALGSRGGRPSGIAIHGYYVSFPILQIALFMAVATAALPYLARTLQRPIEIFIALVALASAVGGHGLPLNVLGSLAIGWGATTLVRLVFGSRSASPRPMTSGCYSVNSASTPARFRPHPARSGGSRIPGPRIESDSPGQEIGISVYGRDSADAKLLTKIARFLFYRDSGPSLTITRLQQVEHQAYLTLRAARAGAAVPDIVEAGTAGPAQDALLVWGRHGPRCPGPTPPRERRRPGRQFYRQLLILRKSRIAHGAISGDTVLIHPATQTATL